MPDTTPHVPEDVVPRRARTLVYVWSLVVESLTLLAAGVLYVLGYVDGVTALALVGVVTGPLALLNSGLGTGYRPTRPTLPGT